MKLVITKIPVTTNKTTPKVPEIMLVKNNTAITAAIINLTILSTLPIFFFITQSFLFFTFRVKNKVAKNLLQ